VGSTGIAGAACDRGRPHPPRRRDVDQRDHLPTTTRTSSAPNPAGAARRCGHLGNSPGTGKSWIPVSRQLAVTVLMVARSLRRHHKTSSATVRRWTALACALPDDRSRPTFTRQMCGNAGTPASTPGAGHGGARLRHRRRTAVSTARIETSCGTTTRARCLHRDLDERRVDHGRRLLDLLSRVEPPQAVEEHRGPHRAAHPRAA
jgi:hypothetical protein